MKNFRLKFIGALVVCLFASSSAFAQGQTDEKGDFPMSGSLQLKNMHLWRGQQITNTFVGVADISVHDKNKMFSFGLWGGAGINGKYKEFDYYASFQKSGFKIAVWDIYNFSDGATYNNKKLFNYSAHETGHFIDVALSYTLPIKKLPVTVSWATVVFGRDRGAMNKKNLYSTYVSLDCPVLRNHFVDLDLGVAGAFALDPEKGSHANFYGKSNGIVNVNLTVSKDVKLGSYTLPISVMGMWNPENNDGNLQVCFNLFSF